VLDPHDRDGVIDVVDEALERGIVGIDDERERHDPEHAVAGSQRLQLPVAEVARSVEHRATARVAAQDGTLARDLEQIAERLLGRVRQVEDHASRDEALDEPDAT
jgi:hypothetical protein